MNFKRRFLLLTILSLELICLVALSAYVLNSKANILPLEVQAQADDLTVVISRDQYYFVDDTMQTNGYIYWVDLKGGTLTLYGNTSDMYEIAFWDANGNLTEEEDYDMYEDRIEVHIRTTELNYQIQGYYYPDYFLDTNFIVIFDTFWAQFSYLTPEDEERYAPVNYHNKQVLPEGAGLVSYAPTDGAVIIKEGDSFGVVWEYDERPMDPFHKPLTYEITYNFDPIYLQFTEQMFQNQQQLQEREQIDNLLDLLQMYFKTIAFLAVVLSIIAALLGYLRAKRKFKSKLNEARNMPKKMLKDIEGEEEAKKRVSALFNAFILILLISPIFTSHQQVVNDYEIVTNDHKITLDDYYLTDNASRIIDYKTTVDLGKDGIAVETVYMDRHVRRFRFPSL